jgi:hypothetical protein
MCVAVALVASALTLDALHAPDARADPASATPAPPSIERHVLGLQDTDVIVDLTAKDGAKSGDEVELWRPLRLVHPVTHKIIVDRFRIATLKLVQVRDAVSVAHVMGTPLHPPATGDLVIAPGAQPSTVVAVPAPAPVAPLPAAPPSPPSTKPAPSPVIPPGVPPVESTTAADADSEAATVSTMFERLRGASLIKRILRYETYAKDHPNGAYARVLLEEAAALRELVSLREHNEADAPAVRHFDVPDQVLDRTPLMLTVEMTGQVAGAVLQARVAGESRFRSFPMMQTGPKYFSATLPADRVLPPRIEYFVDAVRTSGASVTVAGSPETPLVTTVNHVPHPELSLPRETTVSLSTDYADYNRLRGNDHVFQTEGAFTMRLGDIGVRSFGGGFGVYRGVGGSIDDLDVQHLDARSVGLTYGYVQGEFAIKENVSMIARAVLGLRDIGTAGGAQLGVRVGSDLATNLVVSGEVLGGVGLRGIAELDIAPRGKVPVAIRSEVTNQPAGAGTNRQDDPGLRPNVSVAAGDVGVRGIVQVGYRFLPPLVVAIRASYQGRTISHAGPGLGGAVEYRW